MIKLSLKRKFISYYSNTFQEYRNKSQHLNRKYNSNFIIHKNSNDSNNNNNAHINKNLTSQNKYNSFEHSSRNKRRSNYWSFGFGFGFPFMFLLCWFPFQKSDNEKMDWFSGNVNESTMKFMKLLAEYIPSYTFIYELSNLFFMQGNNSMNESDREWMQNRLDFLFNTFLKSLKLNKFEHIFYGNDITSLILRIQNIQSEKIKQLEEQAGINSIQESPRNSNSNIDSISNDSIFLNKNITTSKQSFIELLENELIQLRNKENVSENVSNFARDRYESILYCFLGLIIENTSNTSAFHYFQQAAFKMNPYALWKCGMILESSEHKYLIEKIYNIETLIQNSYQLSSNNILKNESLSVLDNITKMDELDQSFKQLYFISSQLGFYNALCDLARQSNKDVAIKLLELAISNGSSRAMHELGHIYIKDPIKKIQYGFPLLQNASIINYPPALYTYGRLAFLGDISGLSAGDGVYLIEQSAELGFPDAMFALSYIYEKFDHNSELSINMLRKAAASGHIEAQYELAMCFNLGNRISQNVSKAFDLLKSASQSGHVEAQYQLALLYELGRGIDKNLEKSFELYDKLASLNDSRGLWKAGLFLFEGYGTTKNEDEGLNLILKSASMENADACFWLANYFENKNIYAAFEWYNKTIQIDQNHKEAKSKRRKLKYIIMNEERKSK